MRNRCFDSYRLNSNTKFFAVTTSKQDWRQRGVPFVLPSHSVGHGYTRYPFSRTSNISVTAWEQVDMRVPNRLSGVLTAIYEDP